MESTAVIVVVTLTAAAILAFIVGSASPALISLLSVSMIFAGVFLGAPNAKPPARLVARHEFTPPSGSSGSAAERVAEVTAKAQTLQPPRNEQGLQLKTRFNAQLLRRCPMAHGMSKGRPPFALGRSRKRHSRSSRLAQFFFLRRGGFIQGP